MGDIQNQGRHMGTWRNIYQRRCPLRTHRKTHQCDSILRNHQRTLLYTVFRYRTRENGIYTYDRQPKFDMERIRSIFEKDSKQTDKEISSACYRYNSARQYIQIELYRRAEYPFNQGATLPFTSQYIQSFSNPHIFSCSYIFYSLFHRNINSHSIPLI